MPAIHSRYRESGKPIINEDKCTLCGKCSDICPAEILVKRSGGIEIDVNKYFGCITCGHCMMVCPHDAIEVSGRGLSIKDLREMPAKKDIASADQLAALMQSRRSVRRFTDEPVASDQLDRIIEMASTAPMGIPPWDVGCVVVNGKSKVQELADDIITGYVGLLKIMKPWLLKCMRPFIGKSKYEVFANFILPLAKIYIDSHSEGRDTLLYNAPAVMIFHHSPYTEATDAAIACTYAMLAAESLGLGTTMIGGAAPVISRNKSLCKKLGIPEGNTPSIALIIGYPKPKFLKTIRRDFLDSNNIQLTRA